MSKPEQKLKAIIIYPDDVVEITKLSYEDTKKTLDCYSGWKEYCLEHIPLTDDVSAYINCEGRKIGLPRNNRATAICRKYDDELYFGKDWWVAGKMVIVGYKEEDHDDCDVPDYMIEEIIEGKDVGDDQINFSS